jgi:hypothetical protein
MAKKTNSTKSIIYTGHFSLPKDLLNDPEYIALSAKAIKLLNDLGAQYNGRNNGDLSPSFTLMKPRNWNSKDQLNKARKELLERNWIEQTRQGGLNMGPCLYAFTWQPIDACGGKLHVKPTINASRKLTKKQSHQT